MGKRSRRKIRIKSRPVQEERIRSFNWSDIVGPTFFLLGVILFIAEGTPLDNTYRGLRMFVIFAIIGLIVSLVAILALYLWIPEFSSEATRRKTRSFFFSICFGSVLLFPSVASIINRSFSSGPEACDCYLILSKGKSSGGKYGWPENYLFVLINGYEERIVVPSKVWDSKKKADSIDLCLRPGCLGYSRISWP